MARVTGIEVRHVRSCPATTGGACRCQPSYRAWAYDRRSGGKVRRSFATLAAAKQWRADAVGDVRRGKLRAVATPTLHDAAAAWLAGAEDGSIRNRSGDRYKPSALRGYRAALANRILPDLGGHRLSDITRADLQDVAEGMLAEGRDPSTIRNALMPLRAIFRRALSRGELAVNPTSGLELPAVRGRRDRIASPQEAADLLAALPAEDRALWATAMYAGLRRGELMALRVPDIDLAAGVIRVEQAWDPQAGRIEPKSHAGRRTVPLAGVLRDYLDQHLLRLPWSDGLTFGRTAGTPFTDTTVHRRARRAWKGALPCMCGGQPGAAAPCSVGSGEHAFNDMRPIGLHEARHTFASLMIAAGVNAKALSTYMGHANISITLDRYGHLMPGSEDEAAALLDAYLQRANTAARLAQLS
jgi:integrase